MSESSNINQAMSRLEMLLHQAIETQHHLIEKLRPVLGKPNTQAESKEAAEIREKEQAIANDYCPLAKAIHDMGNIAETILNINHNTIQSLEL